MRARRELPSRKPRAASRKPSRGYFASQVSAIIFIEDTTSR